MSTVVGVVDGKNIWIGADSRASTEDGDIRSNKCKKIFRNGDYLFGFIGSVRGGQILFPEYFSPPKKLYELPDAIRLQCSEKGCLGVNENQMSVHACNFLIGYKGKLYEMLIDFQLTEVPEYSAIGAGCNYAFGSLFTTSKVKETISPKERVKLAIQAASEFDAATGGDILIEKL